MSGLLISKVTLALALAPVPASAPGGEISLSQTHILAKAKLVFYVCVFGSFLDCKIEHIG